MCSSVSSRPGGGPSKIMTPPTCMCEACLLACEERGVDRREPVHVLLCRHGRGDLGALYPLTQWPNAPEKLLLAAPRGYCAGVDRAVQTVERALELYGAARLRAQGDRPQQARGRAAARARRDLRRGGDRGARGRDRRLLRPRRRSERARRRRGARSLKTIDATCPLVTKVHVEAKKFAAAGLHDRPDRPRRPRGGRGHDGRGARPHRADRDRGGRRARSRSTTPTGSPTSRRRRCRSTRRTAIIRKLRERFPNIVGSAHRRHLLRDHQPPDGRPPDGARTATWCW